MIVLKKPSKEVFCQSCGGILNRQEEFGTEADRKRSEDYCSYCYQRSEFVQKNITLEQMTKKAAGFIFLRENIPRDDAQKKAADLIPKLKRWKTY